MRRTAMSLVLIALTVSTPAALAAELGTKEEAVAMVKRVQEKFNKDGPEVTFAAATKWASGFNDRDLHLFICRLNGVNVAHGGRPALIGKHLLNLKDPDEILLISQMAEIAIEPASGRVDCKRPNPITDRIDDKANYIEKAGDYFVGVGVYRQ